jgi:cytochrome P450
VAVQPTTTLADRVDQLLADPSLPDPYPVLAELQDYDPVHLSRSGDWVVTRYEDVRSALLDKRWSRYRSAVQETGPLDQLPPREAKAARVRMENMINRDEPDHTRIRKLVNTPFLARGIADWRPQIEEITDKIFAEVDGKAEFDLLHDVAYPLTELTICRMLGVPSEDHALWNQWSAESAQAHRQHIDTGASADQSAPKSDFFQYFRNQAMVKFYDYFKDLVRERGRDRGDDLVSQLISIEEEGDRLSEDEMIGTLIILITAGHDTTANLIGNGFRALCQFPDQYRRLREDPSLVGTAVEEFIRYESAARKVLPRIATEDIELSGVTVPEGSRALFFLSAANRDPRKFTDPHKLDIGRSPNQHIGFGMGSHFCLGVILARTEANIAFQEIATRLPEMEMVSQPAWKPIFTRAMEDLPVRAVRNIRQPEPARM